MKLYPVSLFTCSRVFVKSRGCKQIVVTKPNHINLHFVYYLHTFQKQNAVPHFLPLDDSFAYRRIPVVAASTEE